MKRKNKNWLNIFIYITVGAIIGCMQFIFTLPHLIIFAISFGILIGIILARIIKIEKYFEKIEKYEEENVNE